MAKQTFTTGQVLTATQMNNLQANDYNWTTSAKVASYTLVAADAGTTITMTNASATTITVNTSLFSAGDTVRIINLGAGTCTITAGTATVSSAGSLALIQYQAGTLWFSSASAAIFIPDDKTTTPALTLITSQTIGSAVSTVAVSNAFSSTYDNYQIIISGGVASANAHMLMTLGATATGYYFSGPNSQYGGASVGIGTIANTSSWYVGRATTLTLSTSIFVSMPNLAKRTTYTATYADTQTTGYVYQIGGFLDNATQYTDFTIAPASGTYTGGTIRVYGYQNS